VTTESPSTAAPGRERVRATELTLLVVVVAGIGIMVHGLPLWIGGAVLGAVTAFGALMVLAGRDPRGVPIESLAMPAVAAIGAIGAAHLAGISGTAILALAAGAALLAASLALEVRLLDPPRSADPRNPSLVLLLALVLAFVAFTGTAGAIPGAFVEPPLSAGAQGPPLPVRDLALLAAGDAIVAFLLGYRLTALRVTRMRDVVWAAGTYAFLIAIASAAVRALAVPRLLGPAVLTVAFYIWSAYRAAPGAERHSAQWLWEYAILAAVAALAVAWNVLLR
jgi:hypothetical protein